MLIYYYSAPFIGLIDETVSYDFREECPRYSYSNSHANFNLLLNFIVL